MQAEAVRAWRYSTAPHPGAEAERGWCAALNQITLPTATPQQDTGFHGDVSTVVSPLGIEFSRLSASPQTISGRCIDQPASLWLALLIEGTFVLDAHGNGVEIAAGDLLYGPTGLDCTLILPQDFRLLYVKMPRHLLHPRLFDLRSLQVGALSGSRGVNRIFAAMLGSVAENLEDLDAEQLRPIEIALSEFVIASLWEGAAIRSLGSARAVLFHRICQAIEAKLGDCELSLQSFADEQHASPRYIQKLFGEAGFSFSQYLRQRRLERCRADLSSRAHEALSISEICFRWGFNDAAHFSRSFRTQYGTTPRGFRQVALDSRRSPVTEATHGRVIPTRPALTS